MQQKHKCRRCTRERTNFASQRKKTQHTLTYNDSKHRHTLSNPSTDNMKRHNSTGTHLGGRAVVNTGAHSEEDHRMEIALRPVAQHHHRCLRIVIALSLMETCYSVYHTHALCVSVCGCGSHLSEPHLARDNGSQQLEIALSPSNQHRQDTVQPLISFLQVGSPQIHQPCTKMMITATTRQWEDENTASRRHSRHETKGEGGNSNNTKD